MGLDYICCLDALVFNHVLPSTHASLVPSLTPSPTIPHPQAALKSFLVWFSLKSNLHPSSVASIHKIPSHSGKRFSTLGHLLAPVTCLGHQAHKRNMPFGALTEVVPPHTHTSAHRSSSCPHAAPRLKGKLSPFSYWTQAPCPNFGTNLPSTSNLTTHTDPYPLFVGTKNQKTCPSSMFRALVSAMLMCGNGSSRPWGGLRAWMDPNSVPSMG